MQELWGRKVLKQEITEFHKAEKYGQKLPTMAMKSNQIIQCLRCGQDQIKKHVQLENKNYFCAECIQLGRVDSSQFFYHLPEPESIKRSVSLQWSGELTAGQHAVSNQLVQSIKNAESRMVWAVTGAGKTEMLFQALQYALEQGYRVGITSPRVDVCLELYPRIQKVFPEEPMILLHGKMEEVYRYTKLLVCTTHQLLRFYQAFDVLIIDEVDAFPFVDNALLQYAAQQAVKTSHSLIFLTATPTKELQNKVDKKELQTSILPARYHRRKLPVPKVSWCNQWQKKLQQSKAPKELIKRIQVLVEKNDVLIFCPSILLMEKLYKRLKKIFPDKPLTCVHSQDPERLEKVMNMRQKKYRLLLTSTILERGVTFDGVSVIVLGANHPVYTTSALVQIAGRVDRRKEYTAGEVYFLHDGLTHVIKEAVRQIKSMNSLGREKGLLDEL